MHGTLLSKAEEAKPKDISAPAVSLDGLPTAWLQLTQHQGPKPAPGIHFPKAYVGQMCSCSPVMPAPQEDKREDHKFKISLGDLESDPVLKVHK